MVLETTPNVTFISLAGAEVTLQSPYSEKVKLHDNIYFMIGGDW